MTEDEARVFWAALTPEQAISLRKAAPQLVFAWYSDDREIWYRATLEYPDAGIAEVWKNDADESEWKWAVSKLWTHGQATTAAEARDAADASMRDAGWLLDDSDLGLKE